MALTLNRGDRIRFGDSFGYVRTVLLVAREALWVSYASLVLDDGARITIGPDSDLSSLFLVWSARGQLRLVQ